MQDDWLTERWKQQEREYAPLLGNLRLDRATRFGCPRCRQTVMLHVLREAQADADTLIVAVCPTHGLFLPGHWHKRKYEELFTKANNQTVDRS